MWVLLTTFVFSIPTPIPIMPTFDTSPSRKAFTAWVVLWEINSISLWSILHISINADKALTMPTETPPSKLCVVETDFFPSIFFFKYINSYGFGKGAPYIYSDPNFFHTFCSLAFIETRKTFVSYILSNLNATTFKSYICSETSNIISLIPIYLRID